MDLAAWAYLIGTNPALSVYYGEWDMAAVEA